MQLTNRDMRLGRDRCKCFCIYGSVCDSMCVGMGKCMRVCVNEFYAYVWICVVARACVYLGKVLTRKFRLLQYFILRLRLL